MKTKEKPFVGFIKTLPKNMFSGLVVSLIALPLGLGLAMASEAPPIAGVITAIVGGVIVSILGGSFVTISGPGNGLVGVVLIAITTLGLTATYAAIICSGIILIILGFLRLGKLADYFPSSAIQGMLAAIGLIILGKQFHIMLGNKIIKDNGIDYLLEIPNTIITVFQFQDKSLIYAAVAGVLSLGIMVFYSKIRNKYLQLIPAPMWIVIISVGFSYYYELILKLPNPIAANYMIPEIPNIQEIVTNIPTPNFEVIGTLPFWSSVIALTLIASIESLLSIKAVDKLDLLKRRSNVNKDIKALGLATVVSGFLGGLNVVTVIARSSVNVNNGGSNRSSNLFHALFLVVFILLFSTELTRIPLTALMAILVYTGYKLAAPDVVRRIFTIGKEQLIIFFATLFVTLKVGLISGIVAGLITTFIIHIVVNKSIALFIKNILKPNVLMFKEEDGSYFLSVKHFCSFLNFNILKSKLEAIPEQSDVVLDLSLCGFVDHSVMENIHDYQELFHKKGGNIGVIGLDVLGTKSEHPFALRRLLPLQNIIPDNKTRRQKNLELLANEFELEYSPLKQRKSLFLENFIYFKTKKIEHTFNQLSGKNDPYQLFDITFSEGEFIAKEVVRSTMLYIKTPPNVPVFTLDREGLLEKLYSLAGYKDIDIKNHTDFSKRFYLRGEDPQKIRALFSDQLVRFFESNSYYHVESSRDGLLIFSKERIASIKEIKALLDFGVRLNSIINKD
ncbi:MAG: SulP family inorganic anion transporter [Flavobacteriaceae bacterium]|nr:SulP family inorganic anion transporter [Formosa sp.]MDG1374082.1 SulP family inorganic anion transporter [Flavobacteriaceae bacterium]MDG2498510.1 SulP family inorganic anion transporter [Flavobacteriaceae bacterium]